MNVNIDFNAQDRRTTEKQTLVLQVLSARPVWPMAGRGGAPS